MVGATRVPMGPQVAVMRGVYLEVPMAVAGGVVARQSCRTDTCGMMGWNRLRLLLPCRCLWLGEVMGGGGGGDVVVVELLMLLPVWLMLFDFYNLPVTEI